jgi:hypothetical protein
MDEPSATPQSAPSMLRWRISVAKPDNRFVRSNDEKFASALCNTCSKARFMQTTPLRFLGPADVLAPACSLRTIPRAMSATAIWPHVELGASCRLIRPFAPHHRIHAVVETHSNVLRQKIEEMLASLRNLPLPRNVNPKCQNGFIKQHAPFVHFQSKSLSPACTSIQ